MPISGWSRDQLLKALALYCQIPFGKIHARNPDVIALAAEIGRTPSEDARPEALRMPGSPSAPGGGGGT